MGDEEGEEVRKGRRGGGGEVRKGRWRGDARKGRCGRRGRGGGGGEVRRCKEGEVGDER